jgi:hypothetical protein
VTFDKAAAMSPEDLADKFIIGVLVDRSLPVYQDEYDKIRQRAQKEEGK